MCHHFHDVSCKSGSKIDVRARVSGIMEHAYFEALARDSIKTLEILRRNQTDPLPARN